MKTTVMQDLPGVSVAVGTGGTVVSAEGFGWRDVMTRAPVTPSTRFNIGTAASAVTYAVFGKELFRDCSVRASKDSEFLPFGYLAREQEGLLVFSVATDFK
jgi:hypothetical protein